MYRRYNFRLTLDENNDYKFLESIFNQKWENQNIELDKVLIFLSKLSDNQIINRNVQHSLINRKINTKVRSLNPKTVGYYNWRKA